MTKLQSAVLNHAASCLATAGYPELSDLVTVCVMELKDAADEFAPIRKYQDRLGDIIHKAEIEAFDSKPFTDPLNFAQIPAPVEIPAQEPEKTPLQKFNDMVDPDQEAGPAATPLATLPNDQDTRASIQAWLEKRVTKRYQDNSPQVLITAIGMKLGKAKTASQIADAAGVERVYAGAFMRWLSVVADQITMHPRKEWRDIFYHELRVHLEGLK